jgi:hypothetical protein
METINHKISGTTATKVLSAAKTIGDEPTMTICNIDNTSCEVSVFYSKENYAVDSNGDESNSTEIFFVLKSFNMPNNRTLTLDKTDMSFNNKGFDLYIQLANSSENVDVIINI